MLGFGGNLVDEVNEKSSASEEVEGEWVMLYKTSNRILANFLMETLKQSGIDCVLLPKGTFFEVGLRYLGKDGRGFEVYVPKKKYQKSLEIKEQTVPPEAG
jgi:hypothetical protein